jgi:hypothetical protein
VVLAETAVPALFVTGHAQVGSTVAAGTLVLFTAAVSVNLLRGHRTNCGCSGHDGIEQISGFIVWRNLGLIGFAVIAFGAVDTAGLAKSLFVASAVVTTAGMIAPRLRSARAVPANV